MKPPPVDEIARAVEWLRDYEPAGPDDDLGEQFARVADWLEAGAVKRGDAERLRQSLAAALTEAGVEATPKAVAALRRGLTKRNRVTITNQPRTTT